MIPVCSNALHHFIKSELVGRCGLYQLEVCLLKPQVVNFGITCESVFDEPQSVIASPALFCPQRPHLYIAGLDYKRFSGLLRKSTNNRKVTARH
jgi:hypothetical protein